MSGCVEEGFDALDSDPQQFELTERCMLGASTMDAAIECVLAGSTK